MLTIAIQKWAFENLSTLRARYTAWQQRGALKRQVAKERKELLELDQRMLADIGRTRAEVIAEAEKSLDDISSLRAADLVQHYERQPSGLELNKQACGECRI